jgi:hypothetical protein
VLRRGDDISLVLEHCHPEHRAKYAAQIKLFQELPQSDPVEPQFSLTRKGFAFYEKIWVTEVDPTGMLDVDARTSVLWRQYSLKVEF